MKAWSYSWVKSKWYFCFWERYCVHFSPVFVHPWELFWWRPGITLDQLKLQTKIYRLLKPLYLTWSGKCTEACKQHKYRIGVEGKALCIIPGVVFKFSACRYQSEQFFDLLGSSLRVSCQHWLSCCAFLFSKCFPDGCADFIWRSSNPSLTCCCMYVALFCPLP